MSECCESLGSKTSLQPSFFTNKSFWFVLFCSSMVWYGMVAGTQLDQLSRPLLVWRMLLFAGPIMYVLQQVGLECEHEVYMYCIILIFLIMYVQFEILSYIIKNIFEINSSRYTHIIKEIHE